MSTIYGNWAVTWSDSDHVGVNRQHLLRVPLQRIRPGAQTVVHTATALDFSSQTSVVFGSAYELEAEISAETNRRSLQDMVLAGMKGAALTLVDLAQPDRTVNVYVANAPEAWLASHDAAGQPWELTTNLRFRVTDGTALPDWLMYQAYGTEGLLFKYVPGMDLSDATFTRASAANYINVNNVTTSAASNVARDGHYQLVSSTWTRSLRIQATSTEALSTSWAHTPQPMSVYINFIERGTIGAVNTGNWHIGAQNLTAAYLRLYSNGSNYIANHEGSSAVYATASGAPTSGQRCEILVQLDDGGAVNIIQSINNAASTASGFSSDGTLASAWQAETLWLGETASQKGSLDLLAFKVAAGIQTLDKMRAY